jgi:hypothetical protein
MRFCSFSNCEQKHDSHGYCANHARQYNKYGHPLSNEEVHIRRSKAASKRKPTLGKTWTITEEKRLAMVGVRKNTGRTHFKKGFTPWNAGIAGWLTKKHKEKLRQANTKYTDLESLDNKQMRRAFKRFRNLVLGRDNDTCQICSIVKENLQVDHIKSWSEYPELRFDLDNCRTVCMACHYYVTYKRKIPQGIFWGHRRTQ